MSGRTRGRPRIEHPETLPPETTAEKQPPLQFATIQQVTVLQDQMSAIIEMLQRIASQPRTLEAPPANEVPPTTEVLPAVEIPPAVEILPSETIQTHEMTSTSCHSIPVNWESILNDKVEEAIARRKSRGRPISMKEDPFTEDVMSVPYRRNSKNQLESSMEPVILSIIYEHFNTV
ncbi:hypothetical protein Fot_11651 [Forsythia ovata]|uniref:Uncharacterized protein n=1 Tax=Forsythia ovata TaxID=205694 RepID=A0ABD1WKA9_9LAMI